MPTDWINELSTMDTEALLKALDRIADAAERIAENTERGEDEARPPAPTPMDRALVGVQREINRVTTEHVDAINDAILGRPPRDPNDT